MMLNLNTDLAYQKHPQMTNTWVDDVIQNNFSCFLFNFEFPHQISKMFCKGSILMNFRDATINSTTEGF